MEKLEVLAKLELSGEEREEAKAELQKLLRYIDKLKEADVSGIEQSALFGSRTNVFREDEIVETETFSEVEPDKRERLFVVPDTLK